MGTLNISIAMLKWMCVINIFLRGGSVNTLSSFILAYKRTLIPGLFVFITILLVSHRDKNILHCSRGSVQTRFCLLPQPKRFTDPLH